MLDRAPSIDGELQVADRASRHNDLDRPGSLPRDSLAGFLSAVHQPRKILIAVVILIPFCTYLTLRLVTPSYIATGLLIYEPGEYKMPELQSILRKGPLSEAMMSSQAEILGSLPIAEQVARRGNLFDNPEFNAALRPPGFVHRTVMTVRWLLDMEIDPPRTEHVYGPQLNFAWNNTMLAVLKALHATVVRSSHVLEVSFVATDPLVAAAAVNNAMDAYINEQYAAKHRAVESASDLLERRASKLRHRVHQVEERMSSYRFRHTFPQRVHADTDTNEITRLTEDQEKGPSNWLPDPLDAMNRDLNAGRSQLQAVVDSIQRTALQASLESSEAHEISHAIPPENATFPHTARTMAASVAAAVFLGLLLVRVLQLRDTTLHSGDEVRRTCNMPCLALIPEVCKRTLGHQRIHDLVVTRPLTAFAEHVRWLRVGLSLDIDCPRIIAVTSARTDEGKSLLVLALGRSAQLSGERVLAIECNVWQESFQPRLGGNSGLGLMEVLRGEATWREALQNDSASGMQFIVAGKPGGDALGLFMSDAMKQLLAEVRDHFDLILLDTPPVEARTEARVLAGLAEATLMCVRWRSTPTKTLLYALGKLTDAHASVVGAVLTRVDSRIGKTNASIPAVSGAPV